MNFTNYDNFEAQDMIKLQHKRFSINSNPVQNFQH